MLATFIDHTGSEKPKNHTLEDVAEEMLNGLFCHYEPPDPNRTQPKKKKGILRAPRMFRRNKKKSRRIRWSDDPNAPAQEEDDQPPIEVHCNLASHCVDAGIQAGCVSPAKKEKTEEFLAQYELKLSESQDGRTSYRHPSVVGGAKKTKNDNKDIMFDDEGNLIHSDPNKPRPPPPPPPPPPSSKERFIPQLCGVRLNCGGDDEDENIEVYPTSSTNGHGFPTKIYRRPSEHYNYDDGENSIIDSDDSDDEDDDDLAHGNSTKVDKKLAAVPTDGSKKKSLSKYRQELKREMNEGDKDWETASGVSGTSSAFFRKMWPMRRGKGGKGPETIDESRSTDDEVVEAKHRENAPKEKEMDPVERVRGEKSPTSKVVNALKSLSPKAKKTADDWDNSVPIVRNTPDSSNRQNRWSLPGRGRTEKSRDPSPGPIRRNRSRSIERDDRRRSLDAAQLKKHDQVRSKSPARPFQSRSRSFDGNETGYHSRSHSFDAMDDRRSAGVPFQVHRYPAESNQFNQFQYYGSQPLSDDAIERQSYIAAHRAGFDIPSRPMDRDDALERQSYIAAHRMSFDDGMGGTMTDDQLERQSFIMASRHDPGFVPSPRGRSMNVNNQARSRSMSPRRSLSPRRNASPARPRSPYHRSYQFDNGFEQPYAMNPQVSFERMNDPRRLSEPIAMPSRSFEQQSSFEMDPRMMPVPVQHSAFQQVHPTSMPMVQQQPIMQPMSMNAPLQMQQQQMQQLQQQQLQQQQQQMQQLQQQQIQQQQMQMAMQNPFYFNMAQQPTMMQQPQGILSSPSYPPAMMQPNVVQSKSSESTAVEEKQERELTWEERTRLAWERLRGGVASSFSLDGAKEQEEVKAEVPVQPQVLSQTPSYPPQQFYSPTAQFYPTQQQIMQQHLQQQQQAMVDQQQELLHQQQLQSQPVGILRNGSRRVTFGEPSQYYYSDDQDDYQDENRSLESSSVRRTKKVFRGRKIIMDMFGGKGKKTANNGKFSTRSPQQRSMALSSLRNSQSMSQDYEDGYFYEQGPPGMPQQYYTSPHNVVGAQPVMMHGDGGGNYGRSSPMAPLGAMTLQERSDPSNLMHV